MAIVSTCANAFSAPGLKWNWTKDRKCLPWLWSGVLASTAVAEAQRTNVCLLEMVISIGGTKVDGKGSDRQSSSDERRRKNSSV